MGKLVLIFFATLLAYCYCQIISLNYSSFTSTNLVDWQLNNQSATNNPNSLSVLRLTTNEKDKVGSAYIKQSIPLEGPGGFKASFSASFVFRMSSTSTVGDSDGPGADGLTFTINSISNSVGVLGGGLGYEGIPNSFAVEFDTYYNSDRDPDGNHVGLDLKGNLSSVATASISSRMNGGDAWSVWVDFNGDTKLFEVRLVKSSTSRPSAATLSTTVDLVTILGVPNVYVGFSAGTGSAWEIHDILSFNFTNQYAPLTTQNPTTGTTQNPTTGTTKNPTTGTTKNPTTGTTQNPTTGTTKNPTTGTTQNPTTGTTRNPTTGTTQNPTTGTTRNPTTGTTRNPTTGTTQNPTTGTTQNPTTGTTQDPTTGTTQDPTTGTTQDPTTGTTQDPTTGTTQDPTTGTTQDPTTGTTQDPTTGTTAGVSNCQTTLNSVKITDKKEQLRVDNTVGNVKIEGRYELFDGDVFQSWITRVLTNGNNKVETKYKARVRKVIEFLDQTNDGFTGDDTIVAQSDLITLGQSWNGFWHVVVPDRSFNAFTNENIFNIHLSVDPLACSPLGVASTVGISIDVDYRTRYQQQGSKIALWVRYETFEDVTINGQTTRTSYTGDQLPAIIAQYGQVPNLIGTIPIIQTSANNGADPLNPSYNVYYTFDTTDHSLVFSNVVLQSL